MNPLTNIKNVKKLSEQELELGSKSSWHDQYKDSAWVFVGGIPYDLTEGDVLCVFSQFGEIVNMNMVRDKATGKHKGFGFICFEDQRSTILTVDNLNGMKLLGRTIRVDHCQDYKPPKDSEKLDPEVRRMRLEGCAPVKSSNAQGSSLPAPVENIKKERESVRRDIKREPGFPSERGSDRRDISERGSDRRDISERGSGRRDIKREPGLPSERGNDRRDIRKEPRKERRRTPSSSSRSNSDSSDSEYRKKKKRKEKERKYMDAKRDQDHSPDHRYDKKLKIKRETSNDRY